MKRVWIMGIAGFLGHFTAAAFLERGWQVVGLGNAPRTGLAPCVSEIGGAAALVPGGIDAAGLQAALERFGPPDVVVHAAGSGSVGPSFSGPLRDFEKAVTPTATLLDILRRNVPGARIVLASSAAVYGVQPPGPISEATTPSPVSPYGFHKWMAEILCLEASRIFMQPTAVIRFFSLYGPGLRKQLLWDISNRLSSTPSELALDGTGDETRDMLYIEDAVELLWLVATQDAPGCVVLNGGTGRQTTVRQIAEGLIRHLSPATRLTFNGIVRPGDPRHFCADTAGSGAIGFKPAVTIESGLDRYARWFADCGSAR